LFGHRLVVYAHQELERYLSGRAEATGLRTLVKKLTKARDEGKWKLRPYRDGWQAPNFQTASIAAKGIAKDAATALKDGGFPAYRTPRVLADNVYPDGFPAGVRL